MSVVCQIMIRYRNYKRFGKFQVAMRASRAADTGLNSALAPAAVPGNGTSTALAARGGVAPPGGGNGGDDDNGPTSWLCA